MSELAVELQSIFEKCGMHLPQEIVAQALTAAALRFMENNTFLTVPQAAEKLQVHPQTIYDYLAKCRPKESRHKSIRLSLADVQKMAHGNFSFPKNSKRGRPPTSHMKHVPFPSTTIERGQSDEQPSQTA